MDALDLNKLEARAAISGGEGDVIVGGGEDAVQQQSARPFIRFPIVNVQIGREWHSHLGESGAGHSGQGRAVLVGRVARRTVRVGWGEAVFWVGQLCSDCWWTGLLGQRAV